MKVLQCPHQARRRRPWVRPQAGYFFEAAAITEQPQPVPVVIVSDQSEMWRKVAVGAAIGLIVGMLLGKR